MRTALLLPLLLCAACARSPGPRLEPCWQAPDSADTPLTVTRAETLGDRVARRSTHMPQPPPHDVELDGCRPVPAAAPASAPLDDREREPAPLSPIIRKEDPHP